MKLDLESMHEENIELGNIVFRYKQVVCFLESMRLWPLLAGVVMRPFI
jgi:hypothetical protein